MPTDLGVPFPPDWNGYPPHMSQRDLLIWRHWYRGIARDVINLYFDVGLGPGPTVPRNTEPTFRRMWTRLNQKRADVLIQFPGLVSIVELRAAASASAIGRLLLYRKLYLDDPQLGTNVDTQLVTDRLDADTRALAETHGIRVTAVT